MVFSSSIALCRARRSQTLISSVIWQYSSGVPAVSSFPILLTCCRSSESAPFQHCALPRVGIIELARSVIDPSFSVHFAPILFASAFFRQTPLGVVHMGPPIQPSSRRGEGLDFLRPKPGGEVGQPPTHFPLSPTQLPSTESFISFPSVSNTTTSNIHHIQGAYKRLIPTRKAYDKKKPWRNRDVEDQRRSLKRERRK